MIKGRKLKGIALVVCLGFLVWGWSAPRRTQAADQAVVAEAPTETEAKESKVYAIDQVVVTASKTVRHPDDVPASVTIVTSQDIERQHIQMADEALRQVPGVVSRRGKGWADTMAQVNLRGFSGAQRTLVLYDFQRLNSGSSQTVRWAAIPVEEIERIEVVRGPFSPLYGGNAMGGVINIITKTPKKFEATAKVGYGSYNSWSHYLSAGDRLWDKLSLKLSWTYQRTDGYRNQYVTRMASPGVAPTQVVGWEPILTPTGSPTYIVGDQGYQGVENSALNGKVSWNIADGHRADLGILLNWLSYDYTGARSYLRNIATGDPVFSGLARLAGTGLRFNLSESLFLNGPLNERQGVYTLNTEHKLTETTLLKLRAGLIDQPYYKYSNPSTGATFEGGPGVLNSTTSKAWSGEIQLTQSWGTKHTFTGGVALNFDKSSSWEFNLANWHAYGSVVQKNTFSSGRTAAVGVYLQDEIVWHPKFNTTVGARVDYWRTYDGMYKERFNLPQVDLAGRSKTSFNPRLSCLYRPWEWWSWRASVGTAFRAPNVYELYRTWRTAGGTVYKGNPNLKPEETLSWEVGTTVHPFTGNTITITFFDNYVRNLIYRVVDPADPTILLNENAGRAHIYGVEMEISQKLWDWLEVFGNATLMDPRITKNDYNPAAVDKKITFMPRQVFNFGINANYWILNAHLSGRYLSKMHRNDTNNDYVNGVPLSYDPFFSLDFKLTAKPTKYTTLAFAVDNLLDRRYFQYYLAPGRTFWFEAALKY